MERSNITIEVETLGQELISDAPKIMSIFTGLQEAGTPPTKGQKLEGGFNLMEYNSKLYCFKRIYHLAEESLLTEPVINLHKEVESTFNNMSSINTDKDIPQELKDILNKP